MRQVIRRREHVIGQHSIGMQQPQPLEGAPRALSDRRYQFRMADDFLLIHRRIFWAEHAASIKTG
ncbi:MAG TPA: hypothetical protein VJ418_23790 [Streptosporangiaceae bacterium]|nr:hypothetical protein [Streptosporangiaceae bacterium]